MVYLPRMMFTSAVTSAMVMKPSRLTSATCRKQKNPRGVRGGGILSMKDEDFYITNSLHMGNRPTWVLLLFGAKHSLLSLFALQTHKKLNHARIHVKNPSLLYIC